jgi:hypothetical protein
LGIGLDELIQRDAHRRTQRVTAVTAGALATTLAMGVLTVFAINARLEAERQRGQAEGLIDYMLTDLRDKLKGVGRLDVMTAVNRRALAYYDSEFDELSANSQAQRARVLLALGEDDENRGDYAAALKKFREARTTTAALLARDPDNPMRIFDHAQSEYWIGCSEYDRGHPIAAKPSFLAYKTLADRLIAIEPANPKYHEEVGYADSNLCTIALEKPKDPKAALSYCGDSLQQSEWAARHMKQSDAITDMLIERHVWLADAYSAAGDFVRARAERLTEARILDKRMTADPKNMDLKDSWIAMQRGLARLDIHDGNLAAARSRLERARAAAYEMIKFDASNKGWLRLKTLIEEDLDALTRKTSTKEK